MGAEQIAAEAGAKTTAEGLIAAQVTVAIAREKVIKEEAEAKAKEYAEAAEAAAKSDAEAAQKAAEKAAEKGAKEVEKIAIEADPDAANAATRAANVKRDQEVAEENANILNIVV